MLLTNHTAIVTGGGRGIGRAIALRFAQEGANLALIARSTEEIDRVAEEIQRLGRRAIAVTTDVADEEAVAQAFARIPSSLGRADILVNNAGMEIKRPFIHMPMEEWDRTMAVNIRGAVLCTRAVLPGMLKQRAGSIINVASGAGLRGLPGSAAYSASKAAMIALTQALAEEVRGQGLRVNVICPGPVATAMLDETTQTKLAPQVLPPDDVAGTAVFIASNLSGYITGQVFSVRNANRW